MQLVNGEPAVEQTAEDRAAALGAEINRQVLTHK
jgi:hypothetical protein